MTDKAALTEHTSAAEVERLLWDFQDPNPDLEENLGYLKNLLEVHDASTRAHLSLAEAVLTSTVWADHQELSQNLLWALYTLHDQDRLRLGMDLPGKVSARRGTAERGDGSKRTGAGVRVPGRGSSGVEQGSGAEGVTAREVDVEAEREDGGGGDGGSGDAPD